MIRLRLSASAAALALATVLAPAVRPAEAQKLTVERIYGSPEFRLDGLPALQWLRDGERYTYVAWNPATRTTDLWAVDARTGERARLVDGATLVPPGASAPVAIEGYEWSPDESRLLVYTDVRPIWRYSSEGTYYVYDLAARRLTPVSREPGPQRYAKFSPDGRRIGFVRANDLYVVDLATGREVRLTHDGSETILNGASDWVYEEELEVVDGWRWSPDGERIAFWRFDQSPIRTFYMIDDLAGNYSRPIPLPYPKAGEHNSRVTIGVAAIGDAGKAADGGITWTDLAVADDGYLARMEWTPSGDELVIQRLNRHQNRLDVLLADARTGRSRVLFTDRDSAWVDMDDHLTWVDGGRRLLWSSERDGYNHLYLYDRDGSGVRQLTRGSWDVTALHGVDEARGWVYFTATEAGPLERHLYRVRLDGTGLARVTREAGTHAVTFSPDFELYIDEFSSVATAPVHRLHRAPEGEPVRVLVENDAVEAAVAALGVRDPEFFTFRTSDGVELNGWMVKPPDFDPAHRYPVLLYVYGGPGSQTVVDAWALGRQDRYLWHQLLAERGYIVASVDNRGTGGRGAAFKKVTYRDLGRWEAHDQIEAARHLASLPYVDAGRIGIWGWSYGGYMTALTMMRGGDLFRAGIAVAPVTDWRLYDTIYTERFMRTPAENPDGYRASAPVEHAARLEGDLLLVHGTGDDNVHFQNAVQLAAALQDAGKQFSFMLYPNRNHAIAGGNTRVHLFTMLTEWLVENL